MSGQEELFPVTWHDLPLDPRATNPDADIPTYRCPGCRKTPWTSGVAHVWADDGTYLGGLHHNGCCGYQWRSPAKPTDWWSNHPRGETR